jgi:hypothetical protein
VARSIIAVTATQWLRDKGLGPTIDAFDEVVRFNRHWTRGMEADIGRKTTIWARSSIADNGEFGDCRKIWFMQRDKCPDDCEYITDEENEELIWLMGMPHHKCWPTTGTATLWHLLKEFPVIHTAGWWHVAEHLDDYLPSQKPTLQDDSSHRPAREQILFRALMTQGKLIPIDGRPA